MFEPFVENRPMRRSAGRLYELYKEINERGRNAGYGIKVKYDKIILPTEPPEPHAPGWFLILDIPSKMDIRAIDSMLSIYGLMLRYREAGDGGFYVMFENDEQVDDLMAAGSRLNIESNAVRTFRLREAPD